MLSRGTRPAVILLALALSLLVLAACEAEEDPDDAAEPDDPAEPEDDPDDDPDDDDHDDEDAVDEDADFADAPEIEISLGHAFPEDHPVAVNMVEPWAEEVEERTEGTVTVEVVPGGGLADADAIYENVVAGAMDAGYALTGYTPGRFPASQVLELPFVFESGEQATNVFWDLYEEFPALQEEYDDSVVLALFTHDLGDLFAADQPITEPADLDGLNVRSPGPQQNTLIESLGGSAVDMPGGEIYDSLDTGVIDAVMIANSGVSSFNLDEVADHATLGGFYVATFFLTLNEGTYEQMTPEQQAVIDETSGRELSLEAATAYDEIYEDLTAEYEELGVEVNELDEDALEEWRELTEEAPEAWIEQAEGEGLPGAEMYERMLELAEER